METPGCTGFKGPGARITAAFPIDRLQDRYCSQSQAHNLSAAPVVFDCVALPVPDPVPFSWFPLVPILFTPGHSNTFFFCPFFVYPSGEVPAWTTTILFGLRPHSINTPALLNLIND